MSKLQTLHKDVELIVEANRVLIQRLASETDPRALEQLRKDWISNAGMLRVLGGEMADAINDEAPNDA